MKSICLIIRRLIFTIVITWCLSNSSSAFENKFVHPEINKNATEQSILASEPDNYLASQLGLSNDLYTEFNDKYIIDLIMDGGEEEDTKRRPLRHFHDPLKSWDSAGFKSMFTPALIWAQTNPFNAATWQAARQSFYDALTLISQEEREIKFAETFKTLGQLMHLVSDMAVPAHVRNDAHLEVMFPNWVGVTHFEIYTKNRYDDETIMKYENAPKPSPELFNLAKAHDYAPSPISALFDINEYNGANQERTRNEQLIGLAEYTNVNFLSEGTIFKDYPYPALSETNWDDPSIDPREVWAEDGKRETVRYLVKNDGLNEPIAALSYFYINTHHTNPVGAIDIILDNEVYKSYAGKLVPKAVGYSSALLDYFFRGKMQITTLPIFLNNGIYAIRLNIKNITPNLETMSNGNFSLVVRYTPTDGNADGSDDIFVQADEVASGELPYDGELNTFFFLHALVPKKSYDSVKCMLAFKGTLGSEENAVIGKFFELGDIKFNEEWDNSLNGNYQWIHTTADDNPDNGTTSNIINNGVLIKDNTRYAGYSTPRYNSSYLDFTNNLATPDGILMTPDTYILFKVDNTSINVQPPASPGTTAAWQNIHLRFNDGRHLMFSQEGQGVNWGTGLEAHYTFDSGFIIVDNIYALFQNAAIAIPEPFYLKDVSLSQQLWDITEPSTEEHHQHMENDFIRIIDQNVSQ